MTLGSAGSLATTTLRGLARWYSFTDANSFTDAQVDGLLNRWLHTFQVWICQAYGGFKFTGSTSNTNLVAGTNNYAFPTDFLAINKIEINYSGTALDWSEAKVVDLRNIRTSLVDLEDSSQQITAMAHPIVYVFNNRIYLKWTPANNVTNGIRIYYTSIQTELSGTSDEPLIDEHFQKGLCIGAAIDFATRTGLDVLPKLQNQLGELKADMEQHYSKKIETSMPRILPRMEIYS